MRWILGIPLLVALAGCNKARNEADKSREVSPTQAEKAEGKSGKENKSEVQRNPATSPPAPNGSVGVTDGVRRIPRDIQSITKHEYAEAPASPRQSGPPSVGGIAGLQGGSPGGVARYGAQPPPIQEYAPAPPPPRLSRPPLAGGGAGFRGAPPGGIARYGAQPPPIREYAPPSRSPRPWQPPLAGLAGARRGVPAAVRTSAAEPPAVQKSALTWNAWAEDPGAPFNPVPHLHPDTDYV